MIACATIVAKSYLSFARVIARSFRQHHAAIPFFVLLADEVDGCFDPTREPFELIELTELGISRLEAFRFQYAQQPLSYAATPYLLAHLIARGYAKVVFIKQESLVLGSFSSLFDLLDAASIVMTPHIVAPLESADRISRELNILQSGSFNVGLLGIAAGQAAERFLRWWQDRARTHCLHAVSSGMHYEQRWLDLVPALFEGVHVLRDPAYNVGHWNLPEREIEVLGEAVFVNGRPCRLFRFSGYDPDEPQWITRHSRRLTADSVGAAGSVFDRFRSALHAEGFRDTRTWPYAYATFDNGATVPDAARALYLSLPDTERFGDPLRTTTPDSFASWLNENVDGVRAPAETVSRLWHAIYEWRPDVRRAFPDLLGVDRRAFLNWTIESGAQEHGVPPELLPHRARPDRCLQ